MRESAAAKAQRLLVAGRVTIVHRDRRGVRALVRGDHAVEHEVLHTLRDGWWCNCDAASFRAVCSHVLAVQHVVVVNRAMP